MILRVRTWFSNPVNRHRLFLTIWCVLAIPSVTLKSWRESIPYLVFLSVYAIVTGHWGGIEAAKPAFCPECKHCQDIGGRST